MGRKVNVIGVGMVKFQKPGASDGYEVMASGAIKEAMKDAGVDFKEFEQAYAGYVFGDSTCGQRAVYAVGQTGIPVINVNNNCSTGSSALMLAKQAIEGGYIQGPRIIPAGWAIGATGGHCDNGGLPPSMDRKEPSVIDSPEEARAKVRWVSTRPTFWVRRSPGIRSTWKQGRCAERLIQGERRVCKGA